VTGLAWTEVGGELLSIEAAVVGGKGKLNHTGQLGDVMQESIQAAMTVVRSRATSLGLASDFHESKDIHIHVPEGATTDIPEDILSQIEVVPVRWIDQVLDTALTEVPKPYEEVEAGKPISKSPAKKAKGAAQRH